MTSPATPFDAPEALALIQRDASSGGADGCPFRFEFTSRGDRVPGRAIIARGTAPLVLMVAGAKVPAATLLSNGESWLPAGANAVAVDLPLFGERASAKLSARLESGTKSDAPGDDSAWTVLFGEWMRQAQSDVVRSIDAAKELGASGDRVIAVGLGWGALAIAATVSHEPRIRAIALDPGSRSLGSAELDRLAALDVFGGPALVVDRPGAKVFSERLADASSLVCASDDAAAGLVAMRAFLDAQASGG